MSAGFQGCCGFTQLGSWQVSSSGGHLRPHHTSAGMAFSGARGQGWPPPVLLLAFFSGSWSVSSSSPRSSHQTLGPRQWVPAELVSGTPHQLALRASIASGCFTEPWFSDGEMGLLLLFHENLNFEQSIHFFFPVIKAKLLLCDNNMNRKASLFLSGIAHTESGFLTIFIFPKRALCHGTN